MPSAIEVIKNDFLSEKNSTGAVQSRDLYSHFVVEYLLAFFCTDLDGIVEIGSLEVMARRRENSDLT